jgi:hypothetical protein
MHHGLLRAPWILDGLESHEAFLHKKSGTLLSAPNTHGLYKEASNEKSVAGADYTNSCPRRIE